MSNWRSAPPMDYEEMYGYDLGRTERRDLAVYIGGKVTEQHDYASRMAAGRACPSCATPFPTFVGITYLKAWEAECPNLFASPIGDAARRLIVNGCCPFCQMEVSTTAFDLLVSGL